MAALLALASCTASGGVAGTTAAQSAGPPTVGGPSGPAADCQQSGFPCDLQARFAAADAYAADRPGTSGIVVHDLRTGAVWQNDHAGDLIWTASTIKLAMAVDLLTRARTGAITLTRGDRALMHAMLRFSDDKAADRLWFKYAGADHLAFNDDFPRYGLTSLRPQAGYSRFYPYWGYQKCTPADLDRLMTYVLTKLPPVDRAYLVQEMRTVDTVQRWGVWGAGPDARPGNKNGWSEEDGGWVMNTVGFVGEGERYAVTVMNDLRGEGGYAEGRTTVTQVAKLAFAGYF